MESNLLRDKIIKDRIGNNLQLKVDKFPLNCQVKGHELQELKERTKELEDSKQALLNILEDIEESRALVEEEKNKTEAIIRHFTDGLLFLENEKIVIFNPKAEEMLGLKEEDIKEKAIWALGANEKIVPLLELLKKEQDEFFRRELVLKEELVVEVSAISILREIKGAGTIIVLHDITREKFIEKMKTEFVAIAAHQLRTPISAIKWTLKMLLDGDMGRLTESQSSFLEKIYDNNERMINLVNDLLNVTRIEEGKFLQKMQKYHVSDLLKEAIDPIKDIALKKNLKIDLVLSKDKSPKVEVDKEKIILAVQNLLENAVHYTKAGGVVLTEKYNSEREEFLIKVQDTGIGIPEDQQNRIFSRFFRSGNALKTETEGTGLGLFIAKNIIEAHKGKIWFESQEGKGTIFYFTIPAKEEFDKFLQEF